MERKHLFALLTVFMFAFSAQAQDYKMALGIRVSSNPAVVNTGLSFQYFYAPGTAIEGLLSFDPLAIGALWEKHQPIASLSGLDWYLGGGAYGGFKQKKNFGAQGVLGLNYKTTALPLNLSVDWKPELNIVREFFFEPAAVGLSVRLSF